MIRNKLYELRLNIFNVSLIIINALFTIGCNFSDSTEALSGGYYFRNEGPNIREIISHDAGKMGIYSTVTSFDFNSDYIVAVQVPDYEAYKFIVSSNLDDTSVIHANNSAIEKNKTDREVEIILHNDPYYKKIFSAKRNYWIISHQRSKVFGPLTKEEYEQMCRFLRIPLKLNVK